MFKKEVNPANHPVLSLLLQNPGSLTKEQISRLLHIDFEKFCDFPYDVWPLNLLETVCALGQAQWIDYLYHHENELYQQQLAHDSYHAFALCAEFGQLDAIKKLAQQNPSLLQDMIRAIRYRAFREAGLNGHLPVMKFVVEQSVDDPAEMVKQLSYQAYKAAAREGHLEMLAYLEELAPSEVEKMRSSADYYAIRLSAVNQHPQQLEHIMQADSPNYYRYMCAREAIFPEQLTLPVITQRLDLLSQGSQKPTELSLSSEQTKIYYYLLMKIIYQGQNKDNLITLDNLYGWIYQILSTPEVALLLSETVDDFQPSELVQLALQVENSQIIAILLSIPEVRDLVIQSNFFEDDFRIDSQLLRKLVQTYKKPMMQGAHEVTTQIIRKQDSFDMTTLMHLIDSFPEREKIRVLLETKARLFSMKNLSSPIKARVNGLLTEAAKFSIHAYRSGLTLINPVQRTIARKYDALFNPYQSVLFETALASAIHRQRGLSLRAVNKVSKNIAHLLRNTLFNDELLDTLPNGENIRKKLFKHINSMDCCDFYNRHKKRPQRSPIAIEEFAEFKRWVLETLNDDANDDIDLKMFLVYIYTGFVTRPDRMGGEVLEDAPVSLFIDEANKQLVIDAYTKHKRASYPGLFNAKGRSYSRRPRVIDGKPLISSAEANPPQNIAGIIPGSGVRGSNPIALTQYSPELVSLLKDANPSYGRSSAGIFQPIYNEPEHKTSLSAHFYIDAVYRLNMPLVGAASGGAGTYEVAIALTTSLTAAEIKQIRALNLSLYIRYGFHSAHEVATIQSLCGADYQPGNYLSIVPKDLLSEEDYETLTREFPALLQLKDAKTPPKTFVQLTLPSTDCKKLKKPTLKRAKSCEKLRFFKEEQQSECLVIHADESKANDYGTAI